MPAETCNPWHPDQREEADRNALREDLRRGAYEIAMPNSIVRKSKTEAGRSRPSTYEPGWLRLAAMLSIRRRKLDTQRSVSIATFLN